MKTEPNQISEVNEGRDLKGQGRDLKGQVM
jgi:hypothetical protein